jgi:hypothetical protein
MMENAICQHTLPRCGGGGGLPTYITIYSFHSCIRSIKRRFWENLGVVVAAEEEEKAGVEAVAVEEETDVKAVVEETDSSGVDDEGGERRGLREFWDVKQNDTRQATIYMFKNISSGSLTITVVDSFEIRTEAIMV